MKGGWWRGEIRKDERLRGRGRERETEIEVKDETQWWVVGGRGGRRKLKMRAERRGQRYKKISLWYNMKRLVLQMQSNQK